MRKRRTRSRPPRGAACARVPSRAERADTRPSTSNAQKVQCRSASQAWMEEPCTQEESGAMEEASADLRSTLAWPPALLTIMTRWHESIRSCAGRCSNALQHGDLSSVARRREHGRRLLRIQWTRARHIHTLPNTTVSTYRLFSCEVEYRSSVSVRSAAPVPVAYNKMPINPKSSPQVRDMQVKRNRHCPRPSIEYRYGTHGSLVASRLPLGLIPASVARMCIHEVRVGHKIIVNPDKWHAGSVVGGLKWHCSEPVSRRASKPCHVGLSRTAHGAGAVDGGSAAIRRRPGTPNAALAIEHAPLPEGGSRQKYRVRDTRGCLARPYHRWGAGSTSSQPWEPIARPQTRLVRHRDRQ